MPATMAEWNVVTREIRVKNSTSLGCETKMLREWLKVACRRAEAIGVTPVSMDHVSHSGQKTNLFKVLPQVAGVTLEIVRGKSYRSRYTFLDNFGVRKTSDLVVDWPSNVDRPSIFFTNGR